MPSTAPCHCCDYHWEWTSPIAGECNGTLDPFDSYSGYTEAFTDTTWEVLLYITATGGNFTLTIGGNTTANIAYNASAATIDTAVEALASVGAGNLTVTNPSGGDTFSKRLAFNKTTVAKADIDGMTINTSGLTGGSATITIVTEPPFQVESGILLLEHPDDQDAASDSGNAYKSWTRPALNGLEISVAAYVYQRDKAHSAGIRTSTVGVFVGSAVSFVWRPRFSPDVFGRGNTNADGSSAGGSVLFPTGGGAAFVDGSRLKMTITDVSSGAGTYDITFRYYVGGVEYTARTESSVALTLTDPINIGVVCTDSGA